MTRAMAREILKRLLREGRYLLNNEEKEAIALAIAILGRNR